MNKKKPYAIIQIDCDREWDDINVSIEILLQFKKIFEIYNIKATWFVVGNDLEILPYRDMFISFIKAGHEIGNHTYSHHKDFISLNADEKKAEIEKCDRTIKNIGYIPVGFRTPYFGINDSILLILKKMNYKYDSSVCPSPFFNTITKVKDILNKRFIRYHSINKDKRHYMFKQKLTNNMGIHEIPVSVLPYLKFPAHASYAMTLPLKLPYWYSNLLINHLRRLEGTLVYVFHLNDLCPAKYLKSKEFKYFMPIAKRKEFIHWICSEISKSFEIILTKMYNDD